MGAPGSWLCPSLRHQPWMSPQTAVTGIDRARAALFDRRTSTILTTP